MYSLTFCVRVMLP